MPFLPSSPTGLFSFTKAKFADKAGDTSSEPKKMKKIRKSTPTTSTQNVEAEPTSRKPVDDSAKAGLPSWNGRSLGSHMLALTATTAESLQKDGGIIRDEDAGSSSGVTVGKVTSGADRTSAKLKTTIRPVSSLFDNNSDSEHSVEDQSQPVLGRASSVRVGKPQIVHHKPSKRSATPHKRQETASVETADEHAEGHGYLLAAMPEEDAARRVSDSASIDEVKFTEPGLMGITPTSTDTLRPATAPAAKDPQPTSKSTSFAGLPTGSTLHSFQASIVDPSTPPITRTSNSHSQENESAPTPGVNRTMSSPLPLPGKSLSRRVTIRPSDLVIQSPHRRASFRESVVTTPYPPHLDSDESSNDVDASEKSQKPASEITSNEKTKIKGKRRASFSRSKVSPKKDRFPSPERPETLFLDLSLFRHTGACTTLEIQIKDRGTFDDETVFEQIRLAYTKKLLGPKRWLFLTVRRIGNITKSEPTTGTLTTFDNVDFLKHFNNPRLGHKRKAWVIWLRQNMSPSTRPTSGLSPPTPVRQLNDLNRLSHRPRGTGHSRQTSHTKKHNSLTETEKKRMSTASDASSFHFIYSPAIPRLPFLSNKTTTTNQPEPANNPPETTDPSSPARSFFWPTNPNSTLSSHPHTPTTPSARITTTTEPNNDNEKTLNIPTLTLHHEFRPLMLALLTALTILISIFTALIWTIFGVPGRRPGTYTHGIQQGEIAATTSTNASGYAPKTFSGGNYSLPTTTTTGSGSGSGTTSPTWTDPSWTLDAHARVLTGVVIGIAVFLFGGMVDIALIWGGWLLL